jgi:hypothetical protein
LAPFPAGKKTWWQLASRCCWNHMHHLTCFLSASVRRKDLQFGTWTYPSFQDTIDSVLWHREVGRAKDLSAPPLIEKFQNYHHFPPSVLWFLLQNSLQSVYCNIIKMKFMMDVGEI